MDPDLTAVAARLRAAGCVFAEDEAALLVEAAASGSAALEDLIARRCAGEPLEPLVGWAHFAGLRIPVAPGTFVPRRRTELVARLAVALAPADGVVVDLCTGTGAIAAVVASRRPGATVIGADLDPAAVAVASVTLGAYGATAVVSDMADDLAPDLRGRVDVVTACPPYVPTAQIAHMPREAREHEPLRALDGGADGTDLQRRVLEAAAALLRPGGHAVVETSVPQAPLTASHATALGLTSRVERDDQLGAVVVVASKPRAQSS
ncbi:putative protein N(5)-glutamine methyltransferase [Demequina capsici]|uniref:peptide chain release factor N(5)-glutamine methyltransferase n=1 Tax=Demequina capsici TaxID=3075620 RepID=A0AA96F5B6_9MICO|nr:MULTISPECIES: putative protein N(5)-glutamine methyltransferase [unclassified Demequina]WNM24321.1 putative protein N(5)-glutamine methyltransferase [Demequina sp. OYTSA14]WNM27143.1 putative protein N(5)-glutamine methyltransferase [Demequina sp. PMTSA13]